MCVCVRSVNVTYIPPVISVATLLSVHTKSRVDTAEDSLNTSVSSQMILKGITLSTV